MTKTVYIILLIMIGELMNAQSNTGLVVNFSFNNASHKDEVKGLEAKLYSVAFVPDRFGNSNSACYIQGSNGSFINLGTSDELKPKKGSISLWINIAHPILSGIGIESNPILFTRSHNGEDFNEAYYIGYEYVTKNLNVNTTLSKEKQISIFSTKPFFLREWHHIVMVYDNDDLCFYLDGTFENKIPKNFESQFLKGDSVLLGNRNSQKNKRYYNGIVDDIEIFDKTLSPEEVRALFNAPDPNKTVVLLEWILLIVCIVLVLIILIWSIKRRIAYLLNREKEKNKLLNYSLEQEIKVLKAQMNPHFIFNSLNTILQFIVVQDNKKAEIYLTKFSKLLRKILESTTNERINLKEEIDILNKYLEIESLRFDEVFNHQITVEAGIEPSQLFIPHMLIQPFVENAIWHGLRSKKGDKVLKINFRRMDEQTLYCVIDDNGIGRDTSRIDMKSEKSLAINFIKQRLELMSKIYKKTYSVQIIDKKTVLGQADGTCVELLLPIINN